MNWKEEITEINTQYTDNKGLTKRTTGLLPFYWF
jgi:hypothetical protein